MYLKLKVFFILILTYIKSTATWIICGSPLRSSKEIKRIYSICQSCPNFKKDGFQFMEGRDSCGICGCALHKSLTHINKIARKTEHCPDEPSRW